MFENVGKKLQLMAKIFVIVMSIVYLALAIVCADVIGDGEGFLCFTLIVSFGIFSTYIGALSLYGFGEIIINSKKQATISINSTSNATNNIAVEQKNNEHTEEKMLLENNEKDLTEF